MTPGEWSALSAGLQPALLNWGAQPRIVSASHPAARIASAWRGSVPILTRGDTIFWPGAPADLSTASPPANLATLQHELQHVLDYRTGRLTAARYLVDPREWSYDLDRADTLDFDSLGAEQRATVVEHLWLAENGFRPASEVTALRALIPWAAQAGFSAVGAQGAA